MFVKSDHVNSNFEVCDFLLTLEAIIQQKLGSPTPDSYISQLGSKRVARVAQKVDKEAVETIIEAIKINNFEESRFLAEAVDLLFHYLILLQQKGYNLKQVVQVLEARHQIA